MFGEREGLCRPRLYAADLSQRGRGPPREVGERSKECNTRGRPVVVKVSPRKDIVW